MQTQRELPVLLGSPKQIVWATDIRRQLYQQLQTEIANLLHLAPPTRQSAGDWLEQAAWRIVIRQSKQAAWWIEQRKRLLVSLQANITEEATQMAQAYRMYLLDSLRTHSGGVGRPVRADIEGLSLDELAYEEALVLRLAGIQREARRLGPWPGDGGGKPLP